MRNILFLLCFFMLAACATHGDFSKSELKSNQGILVVNLTCAPQIGGVNIFKSGESAQGFFNTLGRSAIVFCPNFGSSLNTLKLDEGEYFFGSIGGASNISSLDEKDAYKFTIQSGVLNYVGDLDFSVINTGQSNRTKTVNIGGVITDRTDKIMDALRNEYPDLLQKYPFVKSIAYQ